MFVCLCVRVCACVCVCELYIMHINVHVGNLHLLIQQLSCARLPLNPETFLDKNTNVFDSITGRSCHIYMYIATQLLGVCLDKPSHRAYMCTCMSHYPITRPPLIGHVFCCACHRGCAALCPVPGPCTACFRIIRFNP